MTFKRRIDPHWHREVPGARWFKADLHVHTMDDLPSGRAGMPPGIDGPPASEGVISAYARSFLQGAVERRVQVLGVTPHSPRVADSAESSAVWRIVEEWSRGADDDGKPFREKIYAVFPGFEPCMRNGRSGLHLLFLFDPEIGRDLYLKAFDLVMGGAAPWRENRLAMSGRDAEQVFGELRTLHGGQSARNPHDSMRWSYLTLAPHIDSDKGLLGAQKAQVLERFQHGEIAGLELGDDKTPQDALKARPWLLEAMRKHRQAFFHGSDAYAPGDVGRRHTWLKLASPRIEALRQAFIASDSRMRIGYERNAAGGLAEIAAPDVTVNERPWLKSVAIKGRASFFGGADAGSRFELNPDLTCIIGGSMTGKSTFLDGLRVHAGAPLPQDAGIRKQVEARGRDRFLGGSPTITLECPGRDPTAPTGERWPAVFHAQNELQRLAQEPEAVEEVLARLVASETSGIEARDRQLGALDRELGGAVRRLAKLDEDVADAEQAFERSKSAAKALDTFSDAGVEDVHQASRDLRNWENAAQAAEDLMASLQRALQTAQALDVPEIGPDVARALQTAHVDESKDAFAARWKRLRAHVSDAAEELTGALTVMKAAAAALAERDRTVRTDVDRELAARGVDGATIKEFQVLSRQAALLKSYEANLTEVRGKLAAAERSFEKQLDERRSLVGRQRAAFDRIADAIRTQFGGRISARRIDDGDRAPLDRFLRGLNQRGITRWWNDLADRKRPSAQELLDKFNADKLASVGMSDAVRTTFRGCLDRFKQRELAAVRCRDRYLLELGTAAGGRRLDDLSGGQRVSVLLSLLLETNDERPLVIDQPEDELDNRFLFDTVLPALKRLKGRRQIIVATHDANIVVNGDADQVIQLEATADRGRVAQAGAIEEPAVRDAIVRTVDGGDDAFRLRRLKYGF